MGRLFVALSVLGVALAAATAAQQPAPTSAQPVFRTGVDHVSVDVVATDKDDKPITDLTKADFEIVEHGKTQTITDFQFVSVPVAERVLDGTQPAAPEPDVWTNLPPTAKSRLFVLVIDDLHIIESDLIPVKRVMTDFVKALSRDDEVAVVFVGHSNLSQNFTTSTDRLLKAIDHVRGALGFGLDALGQDNGGVSSRFALNYARSAASVLKSVTAALAGSGHARRVIVFVSTASTIDWTDLTMPDGTTADNRILYDEYMSAFDTARRADVPIYTLDPRGQVMPEDAVRGGIGRIGGYGNALGVGESIRAKIAANIRIQQNELATIAVDTGGRAFINSSDLTRAVRDIVRENGSYYLLGYSPDPLVHDGKFHDITVHVSRPGVRVRARPGYVAPAVGPASTTAKQTLDAAMSAGVNVSGLSLRAFAAPVTASAKGMTAVVTVEVAYPAPADGSRRIDDDLQMTVLALDADAKIKGSTARAVHFTGPVPNQDTVTFLIDDVVELPSQPLTLRVGVASHALGKAGTIQIPVDVPNPKDGKLQLSGVVVGFAGAPREGAMGSDAVAALVPFQPTTTRTFAPSDTLRVFARLFWGSKDAAVEVTLAVAGERATAAPHVTLPASPAANGHRQALLDTTVPLTGLSAGPYLLEVAALLASGQHASRVVAFSVK